MGLRRFVKQNPILMLVVRAGREGRRAVRSAARSREINTYINNHQIRKLQIGSGPNILDGWLNTDYSLISPNTVFLDARKPFAFDDATFDYVFSEQQIEQFTYVEGLFMLRECYRVLKPGGSIRIATTSLEALIGLYRADKSEDQLRYIRWIVDNCLPEIGIYSPTFVVNNAFSNWGHRFLYDQDTLQSALEAAGFTVITRYAPSESDNEELQGIESHGTVVANEEMSRFEAMVLEGSRP